MAADAAEVKLSLAEARARARARHRGLWKSLSKQQSPPSTVPIVAVDGGGE